MLALRSRRLWKMLEELRSSRTIELMRNEKEIGKMDLIEVRSAGHKGLGVFAKARLSKGQVIELAPCLFVNSMDYRLLKKTDLIRFVYDAESGAVVIGLGYASLYNHSDKPNATYVLYTKKRFIRFKALSVIRVGTEITINYGYHPAEPETWDDDYSSYITRQQRKFRSRS